MIKATQVRRRALSAFASLLAVAAFSLSGSCSAPNEPGPSGSSTTSTTIGSEGGKADLPGIGSVTLPPTALEGDVTIGMAVVEPPVPPPAPPLSEVVALTPHGLELASPAKISLYYQSSSAADPIQVMRLEGPSATTWEPVGGVKLAGGVATFETMTFSYYVVVNASCKPSGTKACSPTCTCCGTSTCVNVLTNPKHCGACGNDCGTDGYCNGASTCTEVADSQLCDNAQVQVILGELPDLAEVAPEQTTDGASASKIAKAIGKQCGVTLLQPRSQAVRGVLDPCTDAPLQTGGTTDLIVGGTFAQRVARFLEANALAPYELQGDLAVGSMASIVNRSGTHLVDFPATAINPTHDYFVIALIPETQRGALILHIWGVGWEGTPAATHYFTQVVLPTMAAGTRSWQRNLLVEWTDDGDGEKDGGDSFVILATDQ